MATKTVTGSGSTTTTTMTSSASTTTPSSTTTMLQHQGKNSTTTISPSSPPPLAEQRTTTRATHPPAALSLHHHPFGQVDLKQLSSLSTHIPSGPESSTLGLLGHPRTSHRHSSQQRMSSSSSPSAQLRTLRPTVQVHQLLTDVQGLASRLKPFCLKGNEEELPPDDALEAHNLLVNLYSNCVKLIEAIASSSGPAMNSSSSPSSPSMIASLPASTASSLLSSTSASTPSSPESAHHHHHHHSHNPSSSYASAALIGAYPATFGGHPSTSRDIDQRSAYPIVGAMPVFMPPLTAYAPGTYVYGTAAAAAAGADRYAGVDPRIPQPTHERLRLSPGYVPFPASAGIAPPSSSMRKSLHGSGTIDDLAHSAAVLLASTAMASGSTASSTRRLSRDGINHHHHEVPSDGMVEPLPGGASDEQLSETETGKKKRRRRAEGQRYCLQCGTKNSRNWRKGPQGPASLCNSCGIKYYRLRKAKGKKKPKSGTGYEQCFSLQDLARSATERDDDGSGTALVDNGIDEPEAGERQLSNPSTIVQHHHHLRSSKRMRASTSAASSQVTGLKTSSSRSASDASSSSSDNEAESGASAANQGDDDRQVEDIVSPDRSKPRNIRTASNAKDVRSKIDREVITSPQDFVLSETERDRNVATSASSSIYSLLN